MFVPFMMSSKSLGELQRLEMLSLDPACFSLAPSPSSLVHRSD